MILIISAILAALSSFALWLYLRKRRESAVEQAPAETAAV